MVLAVEELNQDALNELLALVLAELKSQSVNLDASSDLSVLRKVVSLLNNLVIFKKGTRFSGILCWSHSFLQTRVNSIHLQMHSERHFQVYQVQMKNDIHSSGSLRRFA